MQNTGTWNSDYAILFFFCLMLPIALYFLGGILGTFVSSTQTVNPPKKIKPPKRQKQSPSSIEVSINFPNFDKGTTTTTRSKPRSPKPRQPDSPKPRQPDPPKPLTDNEIIQDAISALHNLGMSKREATRTVQSLSSKKGYNSVESLVKDALCV